MKDYFKLIIYLKKILWALCLMTSSWEVIASEVEPNDVTPQVIDFGQSIVGQLSSTDDIDKFSVVASTAGTITLSFSSDDYEGSGWYVQLLDSANNLLSSTKCTSTACLNGI